jgi:hypothetical protein
MSIREPRDGQGPSDEVTLLVVAVCTVLVVAAVLWTVFRP